MAIGSPVSYWYGTKAEYNALSAYLEDTLYFITDELTIYKGMIRFAEGVEQLETVSDTAPTGSAKYAKYFKTTDSKIYVYNGTSWGNAYSPAGGSLYYNKDGQRFVRFDSTGGTMENIYDSGVSADASQGVTINGGSTVSVGNASTASKGVVQIGGNINVNNGVISVSVAGTDVLGLVKTGVANTTGISVTNGVIAVVTASASVRGAVKIGDNINVNANGVISISYATSGVNGVVKLADSFTASNLPDGSYWNTDGATKYATTLTAVKQFVGAVLDNSAVGLSVNAVTGKAMIASASVSQKGIVKIGDNISVDANGVISVGLTSTSAFGVVKISSSAVGLTITNGILSLGNASTVSKGVVQINPNDSHITVNNGIISVDEASTSQKGVVQLVNEASSSDMSSQVKAITPHAVGQVADGLNAEINTKQDSLTPGFCVEITANTVGQARYMTIEDVSGATVTLQAGHAYKISATGSAKKLITETIPSGKFGMEGHAEIFVTDTGYVTTADNVVLVDALEANAVNNCTLRFHDGLCLISVEDHVAGYIVRSVSGTSAGSLYAALADTTKEYISVDASLNERTIEFNSASNTVAKEFVGNGISNTLVEGSVNLGASLSMVECTVRPFSISGTGSFIVVNAVLDMTDATSDTPITTTGGVTIGKDVTVIGGTGSVVGVDPRTYGTVKKDGSTTPANYVYGYAQGLTQAKDNYVPIVLIDNVIYKVDALDKSKMSCHERRVCVMDDLSTRHINYYLNPEDLTKKLDGTASKIDGTDGDVMTEFMPSYYLELQLTPQNDTTERKCILMSRQAFAYTDGNNTEHVAAYHDSFKISPDGQTVRPQYMGYYQASTDSNSKLRSVSSTDTKFIYPTVSLRLGPSSASTPSQDSFLVRANANGGSICHEKHYEWLFHLFVCDKLTVHTQDTAKSSIGFSNASSNAWGTIYPRACGYTNQVENFYGGETTADSRDIDMLPLWSGCKITANGKDWDTSPDGCVWSADGTTGKRVVSAYRWRWRQDSSSDWVYIYTPGAAGLPAKDTKCYSDSALTTETGYLVTANVAGTAQAARVTSCKYFIENPWGSIWQNLAGFLPICTGDNIGYFETLSTNRYKELLLIPISEAGTSRAAAEGNAAINWVAHSWPASGWVTTWNMSTFLPLSIGTNVMQDYFYNSTTPSPRAGFRGGYASHGSGAGLGFVFVLTAVGSAPAHSGGRLSA